MRHQTANNTSLLVAEDTEDRIVYTETGFATAPDGTRLFYGIAGEGPVLVLCDGLGCNGFAWIHLFPQLLRDFRVLHWHYRGHGRSDAPPDLSKLDMADLAGDLWCVLDDAKVERACLIGHSMGTQVILEAYRIAPERVTGLVSICGSYGKLTSTFHNSDWLERGLPWLKSFTTKRPTLARTLWQRFPGRVAYRMATLLREIDGQLLKEHDFLYYVEHFAKIDPELWLVMLEHAGAHSVHDLLPHVTAPTLIIAAERDTFTPVRMANEMHELIPGSSFTMVEGGSHALPVEQPGVVHSVLKQFLTAYLTTEPTYPHSPA